MHFGVKVGGHIFGGQSESWKQRGAFLGFFGTNGLGLAVVMKNENVSKMR